MALTLSVGGYGANSIVSNYDRVTEGLPNDIPTRMIPALESSAIEPAGEWGAKLDAMLLKSASEVGTSSCILTISSRQRLSDRDSG